MTTNKCQIFGRCIKCNYGLGVGLLYGVQSVRNNGLGMGLLYGVQSLG